MQGSLDEHPKGGTQAEIQEAAERHSIAQAYDAIFAGSAYDMVQGLRSLVERAGPQAGRMRDVLHALECFGTDCPPPAGLSDTVFRFLCVTAVTEKDGVRLWDRLDQWYGPKRTNLLLAFYGSDALGKEICAIAEVGPKQAGDLMRDAIIKLHTWLPEPGQQGFPLNKYTDLNIDALQRSRGERWDAVNALRWRAGDYGQRARAARLPWAHADHADHADEA